MKLMMKVLSHTKAFSEKDIKDLLFSLDKLLLKIPKNSWENTCVGVSFFNKVEGCSLPDVSLAQQVMELYSFICLTYHMSDNLKIRHKFSPTTH